MSNKCHRVIGIITNMENHGQQWTNRRKKKHILCNDQRIIWKQFSIFLLTMFLITFTMTMFCVFEYDYFIIFKKITIIKIFLLIQNKNQRKFIKLARMIHKNNKLSYLLI